MQYAQDSVPADQREVANGPGAFRHGNAILMQLASVEVHRLAGSEYCRRRLFLGASQPLADDSLASREIERIEPQCAVLRIGQCHAHAITLHDVANAPRNLSKQVPQLEVRYHAVGQIKEKFQTILRALRGLKI